MVKLNHEEGIVTKGIIVLNLIPHEIWSVTTVTKGDILKEIVKKHIEARKSLKMPQMIRMSWTMNLR